MRRRRRPAPLDLSTIGPTRSPEYLRRTEYRLDCYDRLPPELRQAIREAVSDIHDPVELWQFARMKHNRVEVLVAGVLARDAERAAANRVVPEDWTPDRPAGRPRNQRAADHWRVKADADRIMAQPNRGLAPPASPSAPTATGSDSVGRPAAALSWLRGLAHD